MILEMFMKRLLPQAFSREIDELEPKYIFIRKGINHLGFKFGLTLFVIIAFLGIFGPLVIDLSPYDQNLSNRLLPPVWLEGGNWDHIFGTAVYEEKMDSLVYGLDTHMRGEDHSSLKGLLMIPFQPYREPIKRD